MQGQVFAVGIWGQGWVLIDLLQQLWGCVWTRLVGEGPVSGEGPGRDDVVWVDMVHHFATNDVVEPEWVVETNSRCQSVVVVCGPITYLRTTSTDDLFLILTIRDTLHHVWRRLQQKVLRGAGSGRWKWVNRN